MEKVLVDQSICTTHSVTKFINILYCSLEYLHDAGGWISVSETNVLDALEQVNDARIWCWDTHDQRHKRHFQIKKKEKKDLSQLLSESSILSIFQQELSVSISY